MANEAEKSVDTRIVEAKFDSKQFEQGVDKTVKKLDELKKSLNLADSGKSVADLGNKISETTEKASNSLERLQDRFTSFTGMLKQKLISGIADDIVGAVMRIKHSFEGLVSSLSTGQISYGMQRYTDILTSVRTLVSAGSTQEASYEVIERLGQYADQTSYSLDSLVSTMAKFKTAGASLTTAQRMVEGLSNAAASMGVNAQQAERAYLNLQQAYSTGYMTQRDWISFESIPMVGTKFNEAILAAAEKVGTLKREKDGTYSVTKKAGGRTGKSGTTGAAMKGITASNMNTKFASKWFNKEVMEEVFGGTYYFAEVGIEEVNAIKAYERKLKEEVDKGTKTQDEMNKELDAFLQGKTNEKVAEKKKEIEEKQKQLKTQLDAKEINSDEYAKQVKALNDELEEFTKANQMTLFGYQCFKAGQEARSFTDVLNTLKDTISRGWATSFELIFGKLDEATEFFTKMTESDLANAIYRVGEFRNLVLEGWNKSGGRSSMLYALEQIDRLFGDIFRKVGWLDVEPEVFSDAEYEKMIKTGRLEEAEEYRARTAGEHVSVFEQKAEELSLRLSIITRDIGDYIEGIRNWFMEVGSDGESKFDKIQKIFNKVGTGIDAAARAIGVAFEFVERVFNKLDPVISKIFDNIDKILQPLADFVNPDNEVGSVWTDIDNILNNLLKVLDPLIPVLQTAFDVIGDIGAFFMGMAGDTVKMNIQFFSDGLGALFELLNGNKISINGNYKKKLEELDAQYSSGAIKADEYLNAINAFVETGMGTKLSAQQETALQKKIAELNAAMSAGEIDVYKYRQQLLEFAQGGYGGVFASIGDSIRQFGEDCKSALGSVHEFFKSLFADLRKILGISDEADAEAKGEEGGLFSNIKNFFDTNEFVQNVKNSVTKAFEDLKNFIKSIPKTIANLPNIIDEFFKGLFYDKKYSMHYENGKSVVEEYWEPKQFTTSILNFIEKIKTFITVTIPEKIKSIPSVIGTFIDSLFYDSSKKGQKDKKTGKEVDTRTPLKKWFDQAIADAKAFIKSIPSRLAQVPSLISEFFKSLFYEKKTTIKGRYGKDGYTSVIEETWEKREFTKALEEFLQKVVNAATEFIASIPSRINTGISAIGEFLRNVISALFGRTDGETPTSEDVENELKKPFEGVNLESVLQSIKEIGKNIINQIISLFTMDTNWENNKNWLAENVAAGITWIKTKASEAWEGIKDFFVDLPTTIANLFNGEKKEGEQNPVVKALTDFAQEVGLKLSELPDAILNFWLNAETAIGQMWNKIYNKITGQNFDKEYYDLLLQEGKIGEAEQYKQSFNASPIEQNLIDFWEHLKTVIREKIEGFPGAVTAAWDEAKTHGISDIAGAIAGLFGGDEATVKQKTQETIDNILESPIVQVIKGIPNAIRTAIGALGQIGNPNDFTWEQYKKILDEDTKRYNPIAAVENAEKYRKEHSNPILSFFQNLIKEVEEFIPTIPGKIETAFNDFVFNKLPEIAGTIAGVFGAEPDKVKEDVKNKIADIVNSPVVQAIKGIPNAIRTAIGAISQIENPNDFTWEQYKKILDEDTKRFDPVTAVENAEKYRKEHSNPILSFFQRLVEEAKAFIPTIPGKVEEALNNLATNTIPEVAGKIAKIFGGNEEQVKKDVREKIEGVLQSPVVEAIKQIPGYIASVINDPKLLFNANDFSQGMYDRIYKLTLDTTGSTEKALEQAENYKAHHTNPILNFFKDLIHNAAEWLKTTGPIILNGINSALNWIGTKIGDLGATIKGWTENGIGFKDFDKQQSSNPLWESIKSLGITIFNFITQTLPGFIQAAMEWVGNQMPDIIKGIFGGNKKQSDEMTEAMNDMVFGSGSDMIMVKKGDKYDEKLYAELFEREGKERAEAYKKAFIKGAKEASPEKNAEEGIDLWGSIMDLLIPSAGAESADGKSADEDEESKSFFEKAKESLKNRLGSFGGIIEMIESFSTIIKNLATTDVGKYVIIGIIAVAILHILNDIISLSDEFESAKDTIKWTAIGTAVIGLVALIGYITYLASQTDKTQLQTTLTALNDLADALQKIMTPIEIILGILAAGKLFDMFSSLNEWRAEANKTKQEKQKTKQIKEGKKDTETIVKEAKAEVEGEAKEASKAKDLLSKLTDWGGDRITNLLDSIGDAVSGAAGSGLGTLIKTGVAGFSAGFLADIAELISGNLSDIFTNIGEGLGNLSGYITTVVTNLEVISGKIDIALATVEKVKEMIKKFMEVLSYKFVDTETQKTMSTIDSIRVVTRIFSKISGALSLLKEATEGNGDDLNKAIDAIGKFLALRDEMAAFALYADGDIGTEFDTFKKAFMTVGLILKMYAEAMSTSNIEEVKAVNIDDLITFMEELFGNDKFKSLIEDFAKQGLPNLDDNVLANAERIIIFAGAISSIASACKELTGSESDPINNLLDVMEKVKTKTSTGDSISTLAVQFGELGTALGSFASEAGELTEDSVKASERAIDMLLRLAIGLDKIPDQSFFAKLFYGTDEKTLSAFATQISSLGKGLGEFFAHIDNRSEEGISRTYNAENLALALAAFESIARAVTGFQWWSTDLSNITTIADQLDDLAEGIAAFITAIANPEMIPRYEQSDLDYIYTVIDMAHKLFAALQKLNGVDTSDKSPILSFGSWSTAFVRGMSNFGSTLAAKSSLIENVRKYGDTIAEFIEILDKIGSAIGKARLGEGDLTYTRTWFQGIMDGLFGWDITEGNNLSNAFSAPDVTHHDGILDRLTDFLESCKTLEEDAEKVFTGKSVFSSILTVISDYSRAISEMSISATVSSLTGQYGFDYAAFITQLGLALQAIIDNKKVFTDFFDVAATFHHDGLQNAMLMMSTLNQLSQMMTNFGSLADYTGTALLAMETFDWSGFFTFFRDTFTSENPDFFEPEIKPILEITDEFKAKVSEMKKLLGIDEDTGKTKVNVDNLPTEEIIKQPGSLFHMTDGGQNEFTLAMMQTAFSNSLMTLQIPQPIDYTSHLNAINTKIDGLDRRIQNVSSDLRAMKFIINGDDFTMAIGPTIDRYLGQSAYTANRVTIV